MEKTDAEAEVPILWSLDAKSILSGNEGFLYSSVGKESAHNAGDPGSIPGLGRFCGEGIGYHSPILAWRNHELYSPRGHKELDTTERL